MAGLFNYIIMRLTLSTSPLITGRLDLPELAQFLWPNPSMFMGSNRSELRLVGERALCSSWPRAPRAPGRSFDR